MATNLKNVRALVTTRWGNGGYRPVVIRTVESYYVDTALDNDADVWNLQFGDPNGDLFDLFERDNEVRVQLFGIGQEGINAFFSGIADEVEYDEQGSWSLVGRDLSSLAVDSTVPPQQFRHVRAWAVVEQQAKQIGFSRTNLQKAGIIKKLQKTDGSESYWQFWYRLYRKEKMWIWTEPDGTLTAGRLNYESNPTYYFGSPKAGDPPTIKSRHLSVDTMQFRKTTTNRFQEVWVYFHRGDNGALIIARDPTIAGWTKKSRKIMLDTEAHTAKTAEAKGWEEIFEGKVGALEIKVTITDPGFLIRQNRVARLHFPEIDFEGEFFVVGSRVQAGPTGFVQEIRLRQKQYAITRRVPEEPQLKKTKHAPGSAVSDQLETALSGVGSLPEAWSPYFMNATKKWCGPWDYNLFLATLLAICDQETGFRNIRQNGGPGGDGIEWTLPPASDKPGAVLVPGKPGFSPDFTVPQDVNAANLLQWRTQFANQDGDGYVNTELGVGPMQLTTRNLKYQADDLLKAGNRDEWLGGRWHPEWNIMVAAKYLRENLQATVRDSGRDIDMWIGVSGYHRGSTHAFIQDPYAISVKNKVYNSPGYLGAVNEAVQAARQAAKDASAGDATEGIGASTEENPQFGLPNLIQTVAFFQHFNPLFSTAIDRQKAIVQAAMFGYFNRDKSHYSHARGTSLMDDFGPPPNMPANLDCSSFAMWCYKSAGCPDPNGNNYNGQGYTGTLWHHGKTLNSVSELRPGDLVFYANPDSTSGHVAVYVGFNQIVSDGQESGPGLYSVNYRSDLTGYRTYQL